MIALITGGSGSGKSEYAERLAVSLPAEKRIYLATMQVYDDESRRRVERHRMQRAGRGFDTVECSMNLAEAIVPAGSLVLLEDLPNLLANEMFDPAGDAERILPAIEALAQRCAHLIIVTNDVFRDGAHYDTSTAEYMRCLAGLNRRIAAMADYAAEIVYTIPVAIKGERICV